MSGTRDEWPHISRNWLANGPIKKIYKSINFPSIQSWCFPTQAKIIIILEYCSFACLSTNFRMRTHTRLTWADRTHTYTHEKPYCNKNGKREQVRHAKWRTQKKWKIKQMFRCCWDVCECAIHVNRQSLVCGDGVRIRLSVYVEYWRSCRAHANACGPNGKSLPNAWTVCHRPCLS